MTGGLVRGGLVKCPGDLYSSGENTVGLQVSRVAKLNTRLRGKCRGGDLAFSNLESFLVIDSCRRGITGLLRRSFRRAERLGRKNCGDSSNGLNKNVPTSVLTEAAQDAS